MNGYPQECPLAGMPEHHSSIRQMVGMVSCFARLILTLLLMLIKPKLVTSISDCPLLESELATSSSRVADAGGVDKVAGGESVSSNWPSIS